MNTDCHTKQMPVNPAIARKILGYMSNCFAVGEIAHEKAVCI